MIQIGKIIADRYEVMGFIGAGGMQNVYRVNDLKLNMLVVLKTPQDPKIDHKFKNSAIIAARVNHHNVAKTLDYFEYQGKSYLIEELVNGGTLEDKVDAYEYLDPHLAAKIFHQIAKGIRASHSHGVIHRDLKPSNIMVLEGVGISGLKITDFGVATLTERVFEEEAQSGDITRSTSGTVKGALPFMAPEMMFRKAGDHLTEAIDIWSVGAMMFKLMTGIYPFGVYLQAAVNVSTRNRAEWPAFMVAKAQFAQLSIELQSLVEQCLSYDPNDRPTAVDLVEKCQNLCYQSEERFEGGVLRSLPNVAGFFASDRGGDVFLHKDSVYGASVLNSGDRILYSKFPGMPNKRAHPVIKLKDKPIEF